MSPQFVRPYVKLFHERNMNSQNRTEKVCERDDAAHGHTRLKVLQPHRDSLIFPQTERAPAAGGRGLTDGDGADRRA